MEGMGASFKAGWTSAGAGGGEGVAIVPRDGGPGSGGGVSAARSNQCCGGNQGGRGDGAGRPEERA
eukprot:4648377-Pyramimonas_sp.AAC.1